MKFWIVTPSYNQLNWLQLCIASVADQVVGGMARFAGGETAATGAHHSPADVSVHHHIQDARSTDGTPEWLAEYVARKPFSDNCTLSYASEPDDGMYDAINRGWKRAADDVDVVAHLNCDEQYLPDALRSIAEFFKTHPKADVVLADMIVVDKDGEYICHRRSLKPYPFFSRFCCAGFTAATFHRAAVTKEKKVFFDISWRNIGDKVWYNALHKARCTFAVLNKPVSTFTVTGKNMNWTDEGLMEQQRYNKNILKGIILRVDLLNGIRRWLKEQFLPSPNNYALYGRVNSKRITKAIDCPTGRWGQKFSR